MTEPPPSASSHECHTQRVLRAQATHQHQHRQWCLKCGSVGAGRGCGEQQALGTALWGQCSGGRGTTARLALALRDTGHAAQGRTQRTRRPEKIRPQSAENTGGTASGQGELSTCGRAGELWRGPGSGGRRPALPHSASRCRPPASGPGWEGMGALRDRPPPARLRSNRACERHGDRAAATSYLRFGAGGLLSLPGLWLQGTDTGSGGALLSPPGLGSCLA